MKDTLETIKKIYSMLEDEESKELYMKRLAYYASGNPKYIFEIIDTYTKKCIDNRDNRFGGYEFNIKAALLFYDLPKNREFVLYGAGENGARLLPYAMYNKNFAGFCSSTKSTQENGYLGFPVMSPEELLSRKDLTVVISTENFRDEIMQILKDGNYPQEQIVDGPKFYNATPGEREQYFGPGFMKFRDEEIFVDAGCFDFQSSFNLAAHCKRVKVYAFEPDPENYQQCLKRIEKRNKNKISDVRIFPCGVWSEKTMRYFNSGAGSSSRVCIEDEGTCSVPVMTIDEAIEPGDQVTMIKMDIEGSELEALKGAQETIRRDKPKLAICIYHKTEDLWEIPLFIKNLVPEYRLYIRHHHGFSLSETVLYAIMPE